MQKSLSLKAVRFETIVHLRIKDNCKGEIQLEQFKIQYRRTTLLENQRARQTKYMTRHREELGNEVVKKFQNQREKKCIDKKRAELGIEIVKKDQNTGQNKCIDKKRVELGPSQLNHQINERQAKSRKRNWKKMHKL